MILKKEIHFQMPQKMTEIKSVLKNLILLKEQQAQMD